MSTYACAGTNVVEIDLTNSMESNFQTLLTQFNDLSYCANYSVDGENAKTFMNNVVNLMNHVNDKNRQIMKNFNNSLNSIENNLGGEELRDIDNLTENESLFDKLSTMNKDQMMYFLDKYFYLIIKIVFILVIFYIMYTRSAISLGMGLSFTGLAGNLYNKAKDLVNGTSGFVKKVGTKVGDLEAQQKMKENIKRQQKPKVNNDVKVISSSTSGFGSTNPKFGTNPSNKDILTQSLDRV